MSDIIGPLLATINTHPEWAGLATFLISAAESVAIIGTIIPGSITMTAIGALAGAGIIPLWQTLLLAILGAIVGDGISYWIGYRFKDRLPFMWPFRKHPGFLTAGESFFYKYGGMSVFIGRFVGPVRALVPLVAGMLGMRPFKFVIANIASAIGWAPAYMLPGILLGAASLELPPDITIHVAMVVLFIVLSTLLCLWFVYQLLKLNLALYALLLSTALVALLGYVKIVGSANIFVNDACLHLFRGSRNASLDTIMLNVTFLGESPVILYAAVVFIMGLVALKRYITAWHACILMIATFSLNTLLKHLIASPRPWGIYHQLASFSMPSGHATLATTTYMGLALLIASTLRPGRRAPIYMLGLILSFLVGISRLYLNAHWFTDVLAGWMLSALLLIAVTLSYKRYHEKLLSPFIILLLAIIPLSLSFAHDHHKHFKQLSVDYAKINPPITLVHLKTWWQQDNAIPYHRTSLFGFPSHIINIEWVGSFNDIQSTLLKMGWTIPPARDLASIIHRLADISSANYLPMISPQYLDEKPKIVLTRYIVGTHQKKQLLVLRLWDGNARLAENHETLWVGTIGEIPRTYSWLFTVYHPPHTFKLGPELFLPTAQTHPWRWKIIVKPRTINKNTIVNQEIMLITD